MAATRTTRSTVHYVLRPAAVARLEHWNYDGVSHAAVSRESRVDYVPVARIVGVGEMPPAGGQVRCRVNLDNGQTLILHEAAADAAARFGDVV